MCLNSQTLQVSILSLFIFHILIADSFFNIKKYYLAGIYYNRAFNNNTGYFTDFYRIRGALSWTYCNNIDSAIFNLYAVIYAPGFSDYGRIYNLFRNTNICNKKEFKKILRYCKKSELNKNKPKNEVVKYILDSIYLVDQSTRSIFNDTNVYAINNSMSHDKSNINIIDSLYNIHGLFSKEEIGYKGSIAQFLVIQHSELGIQQKWLKRISKAVNDCILTPECYALLKDRVLIAKGKKQIYGTQIFFDAKLNKYIPYPIKDENKVNTRRLMIGMNRLETYLLGYN